MGEVPIAGVMKADASKSVVSTINQKRMTNLQTNPRAIVNMTTPLRNRSTNHVGKKVVEGQSKKVQSRREEAVMGGPSTLLLQSLDVSLMSIDH